MICDLEVVATEPLVCVLARKGTREIRRRDAFLETSHDIWGKKRMRRKASCFCYDTATGEEVHLFSGNCRTQLFQSNAAAIASWLGITQDQVASLSRNHLVVF